MFGAGPAKTKPGDANFAVADPPLKLVLFEGAGAPGSINHLGVFPPFATACAPATITVDRIDREV